MYRMKERQKMTKTPRERCKILNRKQEVGIVHNYGAGLIDLENYDTCTPAREKLPFTFPLCSGYKFRISCLHLTFTS